MNRYYFVLKNGTSFMQDFDKPIYLADFLDSKSVVVEKKLYINIDELVAVTLVSDEVEE